MQRDDRTPHTATPNTQHPLTRDTHSTDHRPPPTALESAPSCTPSAGSKRAHIAYNNAAPNSHSDEHPAKAAKGAKTHSPNSHAASPPHSSDSTMASQSVQPAQSVAAATPAPASAASSAGAAGAGAGAGSGAGASSSSSSSSFQPNAAQRNQLAELRSLQALSSFERSNSAYCNQVYNTHCRMIESTIVQVMNDPSIELAEKDPTIKIAPMAWRFDVFPALNKGGNQYTYAYETDIPGTTYMMTPQPSFYLPKVCPQAHHTQQQQQH